MTIQAMERDEPGNLMCWNRVPGGHDNPDGLEAIALDEGSGPGFGSPSGSKVDDFARIDML